MNFLIFLAYVALAAYVLSFAALSVIEYMKQNKIEVLHWKALWIMFLGIIGAIPALCAHVARKVTEGMNLKEEDSNCLDK